MSYTNSNGKHPSEGPIAVAWFSHNPNKGRAINAIKSQGYF